MLEKKVLDSIDPAIRDLMGAVNELPFVDQTLFSCSGHLDRQGNFVKSHPGFSVRYVAGKYDDAKDFHRQLKKVGGKGYSVKSRGYPMYNYDPYTSQKITPSNGFQPSDEFLKNDIGEENQKLVFEKNKNFDVTGEAGPLTFLRDGKPAASYDIVLDFNSGVNPSVSLPQAWTDIDSVVSRSLGRNGDISSYFDISPTSGEYTGKFSRESLQNN